MSAFDSLAAAYDADFTERPIARWLRERTHDWLLTLFMPGARVLELGSGTGEDAAFLIENGIEVTVTDASQDMLVQAQQKLGEKAAFASLDINALPDDIAGPFDGVFANFGVLNCTDDWKALAEWLAERIPVGGKAAFCVMAPYCAWEVIWHGLHLDLQTATRRWREAHFEPDEQTRIRIHYPSVRQITRAFAPYFRRTRVLPLGIVLPPSDIYGVIEKRARLLRSLLAWERRLHWPPLANFADHYWIEFERV